MRILFTCIPGLGHLNPILPLANALQAAGHVVAVATAAGFNDVVTHAGLECIPAGLDWDERRVLQTLPELRSVDGVYRGEWIMKNIFLDRSPRCMIPDLLAIVPGWRPDLIISGSFEYGGPLAAEKLDLPYVSATYTSPWDPWILKYAVGRSMAKLRRDMELPADPEMKAFGRYLDVCFAPPSFAARDALLRPALTRLVQRLVVMPGLPLRRRLWGLRALAFRHLFARSAASRASEERHDGATLFVGDAPLMREPREPPAWLTTLPSQPTVFVSLGTVLAAEHPELFDKVLTGLREKPINIVITLGGTCGVDRFGPQPDNIRIVPFLTQDEMKSVLPHMDICLSHAGYSSIMDAALRAIPQILFPLVSDAPMNTQMCISRGICPDLPPEVWGLSPKGLPVVRPDRVTAKIICDVVNEVLTNPTYRRAARDLQIELDCRLGLPAAIEQIEAIVERKRMR